jgi:anti-sigma factor RsiW
MSNINEIESLSAYLDLELESDELNRVNVSLARSAAWREELENLRKTKMILATAPRISAPPDLIAGLLREHAHAVQPKPLFRMPVFPRMWVWASSAATALVMVGIWITSHAPAAHATIPLEPLMAAHARMGSSSALPYDVVSASNYSRHLAAQHAKSK